MLARRRERLAKRLLVNSANFELVPEEGSLFIRVDKGVCCGEESIVNLACVNNNSIISSHTINHGGADKILNPKNVRVAES